MTTTVLSIRRYPVKSMGGEYLDRARVDDRGLVGDRQYAVVDTAGQLASGKTTRRFRRRDRVFDYTATTGPEGVTVHSAAGAWAVGSADLDHELSHAFADPVQVRPEVETPHFDAGAVSLVGSASLEWCREHLGVDADPRRLRVNLVLHTEQPFEEEALDATVAIGDVRLRPVERIERCRTIDLAQDGAAGSTKWLKALGADRDLMLGVYFDVAAPGEFAVGDEVVPG